MGAGIIYAASARKQEEIRIKMTTPYYNFTKEELPISPLKINYNKHEPKVNYPDYTTNVLPLLTGPPITFAVVEMTQKEVKDEEKTARNETIEGENRCFLANLIKLA